MFGKVYTLLPTHRQPERMRPQFQSHTITSRVFHLTRKPSFRWIAGATVVVGLLLWFLVLPSVFVWDRYPGPPFFGSDPPPIHPYPPHRPPVADPTLHPPTQPSSRAVAVRDAFLHAYNGYTRYAMGYDELRPVSGGKINK